MDDGLVQQYYTIIRDKIAHFNFESAIRSADKIISYRENDDGAYYYKGVCCFALEKYQDAINFFKKALELNPGFGKAYFNLGATYHVLNKYDTALINIGKALIIFARDKELDCKDRCMQALQLIQDERRA